MTRPGPTLSDARTLLYVIGAQKAGTTWFHHQFSRHPEMHFARKEFHYWNARRSPYVNFRAVPIQPLLGTIKKLRGRLGDVAMHLGPRTGDGVLAWRMVLSPPEDHASYRAGLVRRMPASARILGDITPDYALLSAKTFAEMADMHPETRFIFIMRDPVDRLWSGVRHRLNRWFNRPLIDPALAARWFEMALEDEYNVDLRKSRYEDTITRIERAGISDRVLYLFYENMFTDDTMVKINAFLGVERHDVAHDTRVLQTKKWPVSPSDAVFEQALSVLQPTYEFVRSRFGAEVPSRWRDPSARAVAQVAE